MPRRRHYGPQLSLTILAVFALGYAFGIVIGWVPRAAQAVIDVPDDGPRAAVVSGGRLVGGPRPSEASRMLVLKARFADEGHRTWAIEQQLVGVGRLRTSVPWRSVEFANGYEGRHIRFQRREGGYEVDARFWSCTDDAEALVIGPASSVSVVDDSLRFDLLVVLPGAAQVERWIGWLGPVEDSLGWKGLAAVEER